MHLIINGSDRDFPELAVGSNVEALIAALGFRADRVALERNGEIVPRNTWPLEALAEGDRLEVVHFVGGGAPTCRR